MQRLFLVLLATTLPAQENWPQFLGPGSKATASGAKSLRFDKEKDLLYSVAIPAGASSPCIWGDRIFLTGVADQKLAMFALDRKTGKQVWRHDSPAPKPREFKHKDGGVAMPTACTNGKQVFFYLPSYGLIARDFAGKKVWEKRLKAPKTDFGIGASPTLCGGNVILVRDGCPEPGIYAFDQKSGEEKWSIPRVRFYESHTTPFVWKHADRTELIVASTGTVMSFDPADGEPLWSVSGLTPLVCTTPTASEGHLIFAGWSTPSAAAVDRLLDGMHEKIELTEEEKKDPIALFNRFDTDRDGKMTKKEAPRGRVRDAFRFFDGNKDNVISHKEWVPMMRMPKMGKNVMIAIKPGGEGNITRSHVAWTARRGIPYVASPLYYKGRVFLVKAGGVLGGYDAKTGKQVIRRKRLPDHSEYYATPLGVDGKVLACSAGGTLYVLDPEDKLKVVTSVKFDEPIFATPAVVDGVVYVRTRSKLYAFGK